MDATDVRAFIDGALKVARIRTVVQLAVCAALVLAATAMTQPIAGVLITAPPAAFVVAVTLGREQGLRRSVARARTSGDRLLSFYRGYVEDVVKRRRRLRFLGPLWLVALWAAVKTMDVEQVPGLRAGVLLATVALLALTANAFVSVPKLSARLATLGPSKKSLP